MAGGSIDAATLAATLLQQWLSSQMDSPCEISAETANTAPTALAATMKSTYLHSAGARGHHSDV